MDLMGLSSSQTLESVSHLDIPRRSLPPVLFDLFLQTASD